MTAASENITDNCSKGIVLAAIVPRVTSSSRPSLHIDESVLLAQRQQLPDVATGTVAAITSEVPSYAGALRGRTADDIATAVSMALAGFLKLAGGSKDADPSTPLGPALDGAYALGRGEARGGQSMDALLAAYRVGARVAWRELASSAAEAGVGTGTLVQFAELVFAYIDELSAASVAGHTDELATSGRVRERAREQLGRHLIAGADEDTLTTAAGRAAWTPPETLTAVLLPSAQVRSTLAALGEDVLYVGEDLPGAPSDTRGRPLSLFLVPDVEGLGRQHLLRVLRGTSAILGPARRWMEASSSFDQASKTAALPLAPVVRDEPTDSEDHLARLIHRRRGPRGRARPPRPGAGSPRWLAATRAGEALTDVAILAPPPRPSRRGGRRPLCPRPDRSIPYGPAAGAAGPRPRRPVHRVRTDRYPAARSTPSLTCSPLMRFSDYRGTRCRLRAFGTAARIGDILT